MNLIFWGLIISTTNVALGLGAGSAGFFPGFLGYYMIAGGLGQLPEQCRSTPATKKLAWALMALGMILWLGTVGGVWSRGTAVGAFANGLDLFVKVMTIGLYYQVQRVFRELEEQLHASWRGERMFAAWAVTALAILLLVMSSFLTQQSAFMDALASLALVAGSAGFISYLFFLYRASKECERLTQQRQREKK